MRFRFISYSFTIYSRYIIDINELPVILCSLQVFAIKLSDRAKRDSSAIIQLKFFMSSRRKDNRENRVSALRVSSRFSVFRNHSPFFFSLDSATVLLR